jgi:hypothetical protein
LFDQQTLEKVVRLHQSNESQPTGHFGHKDRGLGGVRDHVILRKKGKGVKYTNKKPKSGILAVCYESYINPSTGEKLFRSTKKR